MWLEHTRCDIKHLIQLCADSAVFATDNKAIPRLEAMLSKLNAVTHEYTANHYYFIMQAALSCIQDDHVGLDFSKTSDREFAYYGFITLMHNNKVVVLYSIVDDIPIKSVITHVNQRPVSDVLSVYINHFGSRLRIQQLNEYAAAALICVYNPFAPIKTVTTNNKVVSVRPMRVNSNVINKRISFTRLVEILKSGIEHFSHGRPSLDIQVSKLANISYIDVHSFNDPQEQMLIRNMKQLSAASLEWVILDFRSNTGGSINILLAILYYLYPREVMQYIAATEQFEFRTGLASALAHYEDRIQELILNSTNAKMKRYLLKLLNLILHSKEDFVLYKFKHVASITKQQLTTAIRKVAKSTLGNKKSLKVVVVINQVCLSACAFSSKILSLLPNVVLIGQPVERNLSGNMHVFDLLSGRARVFLPLARSLSSDSVIHTVVNQVKTEPDILINPQLVNEPNIAPFIVQASDFISKVISAKCNAFLSKTRR